MTPVVGVPAALMGMPRGLNLINVDEVLENPDGADVELDVKVIPLCAIPLDRASELPSTTKLPEVLSYFCRLYELPAISNDTWC
jgi:hypothetical protein